MTEVFRENCLARFTSALRCFPRVITATASWYSISILIRGSLIFLEDLLSSVLFILGLYHWSIVHSGLFSTQRNTPSRSVSLRNRREHDVTQWLVLLDFTTWRTIEIADHVVHNPSSSEYFNRLEVHPQVIKQIFNAVGVSKSCIPSHASNARPSRRSKSLSALLSGVTRLLDTRRPLQRLESLPPSFTTLSWITTGDIDGRVPLVRPRRMSFPVSDIRFWFVLDVDDTRLLIALRELFVQMILLRFISSCIYNHKQSHWIRSSFIRNYVRLVRDNIFILDYIVYDELRHVVSPWLMDRTFCNLHTNVMTISAPTWETCQLSRSISISLDSTDTIPGVVVCGSVDSIASCSKFISKLDIIYISIKKFNSTLFLFLKNVPSVSRNIMIWSLSVIRLNDVTMWLISKDQSSWSWSGIRILR